eukprot:934494-Lingulodinium_polyedra.AAC.1
MSNTSRSVALARPVLLRASLAVALRGLPRPPAFPDALCELPRDHVFESLLPRGTWRAGPFFCRTPRRVSPAA